MIAWFYIAVFLASVLVVVGVDVILYHRVRKQIVLPWWFVSTISFIMAFVLLGCGVYLGLR